MRAGTFIVRAFRNVFMRAFYPIWNPIDAAARARLWFRMPHDLPPAAHQHSDLKSVIHFILLTVDNTGGDAVKQAQRPDGPHGEKEEMEWKD